MSFLCLLGFSCLLFHFTQSSNTHDSHGFPQTNKFQPNIIFMFCDDCGFNDFGFNHESNVQTPFIDTLVKNEGLIINTHYVHNLCSPTRAAFLSGRYAHKLGLQVGMLTENTDYALTRQVSLLSNEFQSQGYATHAIGKWHLGYQTWEYTPTYRGFDTFAGFYNAKSEYFTHKFKNSQNMDYYDLRLNEEPVRDATNIYGTQWEQEQAISILKTKHKLDEQPFFMYLAWQAAHEPSEAPMKYQDIYCVSDTCDDSDIHKAQLTSLDDNIQTIVTYLKDNDLWSRTLLVFSGDNGGAVGFGDNFPLRSYKFSPFEGGVRVPAFVTGGFLNPMRYGEHVDEFAVHVTDWYPTLLSAAGLSITHAKSLAYHSSTYDENTLELIDFDIPLDGYDIWQFIQYGTYSKDGKIADFFIRNNDNGKGSSRNLGNTLSHGREIILNINNMNCKWDSCGSMIIGGRWKYVRGGNMCGSIVDCNAWMETSDTNILKCESYSDISGKSVDEGGISAIDCIETEDGCLFDIIGDPCEYFNLGERNPNIVNVAKKRLQAVYDGDAIAPLDLMGKLRGDVIDPALHGDVSDFWGPFQLFEDVQFEKLIFRDFTLLYEGRKVEVGDYEDDGLIVDVVSGEESGYHSKGMFEFDDDDIFAIIIIGVVSILLLMLCAGISYFWRKVDRKSEVMAEMQPLLVL